MAVYTVKPGDNLSVIARKLGLSSWRDLYDANKKVIGSNPNLIRPGQKLTYGTTTKKAESKDMVAEIAAGVTKTTPKQEKTFEQIFKTEEDYLADRRALAEQGVAQQTQSEFLPKIDKGIESIRKAFASRGLFRSGFRGEAEKQFFYDTSVEEKDMRDELMSNRLDTMRAEYQKMQSDYETALKQGKQYTVPDDKQVSFNVTDNQPFQPTGQLAGSRYSPIGAYEGTDTGDSRFGIAYKKWYEDRFKKMRPDVSYKY